MSESDEAGNTLVIYTREPGPNGPLLSENRGGEIRHYHYDAQGSTIALTDETGQVTDTFAYDAWGNTIARTGTTETPYQWLGRLGYAHDVSTGGHYVRNRWLDPLIARWTSQDPLPESWAGNLYRYADNSPVLLVDPSGLQAQVQGGPRFAPEPSCTEAERKCVRDAWELARNRIKRNPECFARILCNGKRSACDPDALLNCIMNALERTQYSCADRGQGGCHQPQKDGDKKNVAHTQTPCGAIKSLTAIGVISPPIPQIGPAGCVQLCNPCQSPWPFANDCGACPDSGMNSIVTYLCRDIAPGLGKECDQKAIVNLANTLVHEASHSCVGGHDTTGGKGKCDACNRPDSYEIEAAFTRCP